MNRLYFSTVNVIVLLFAYLSYAGDSSLPNPYVITYPFKSAVIHFAGKSEYGHDRTSKGTEVVYIKDDKMAKVIKMTIPGPNETTKNVETLRIFTPDYVYMIDLTEKTGIKRDNSKKYGKVAYNNLSEEEKKAFHSRMERRGIISLDLLGLGKKIGTDTILGRKCDVYESGKKLSSEELLKALESGEDSSYTKSWIWRTAKIPLRIITVGVGRSNELIAIKIEEKVKIPDTRFTVPSDIKVTYDEEKSEFAKRETLARFELYKTGKPKVVRMKVKKEVISPEKSYKPTESDQKSKENQK